MRWSPLEQDVFESTSGQLAQIIFLNIFHGYFVSVFKSTTTLAGTDSRGAPEPFSPVQLECAAF